MTRAVAPGDRGPTAAAADRGLITRAVGPGDRGPTATVSDPVEPTDPSPLTSEANEQAAVPLPSRVGRQLLAGWRTVTNRGRAAMLLAVLAALLGAVTGWREWTGIAASLAVLLLAAVVSALGRSSCAVTLEQDRRRFVVGEPGSTVVEVTNTANRRMLPLRMELEVAGTAVTVRVPSLPGGGTHRMEIPLPTAHRAVLVIGPLRAVRGDVFGLIRRVVHWPIDERVYVHPRTVRPSGALPGFVRDLEGEESTRRTASDLSFHTLREYVPGDDRRFIHWKSTARNGTLQVREFRETHRSLVAVVVSGNRGDYYEPGVDRVDDAVPAGGASTGVGPTGAGSAGADPAGGDPTGGDPAGGGTDAGRLEGKEFELAVGCAASLVAELVRGGRDVVTEAAGTPIRAVTAEGVLDQFSGIGTATTSPDLVFDARRAARRHPRMSLLVLVFGSTVAASRVRAAMRACPPGASVLAVRARTDDSPHPARLTGSDAFTVLTVGELELLPVALRSAA